MMMRSLYGLWTVTIMRADYIAGDTLRLLLTALMPANRRALEVSEATGLRIGDVLAIRTADMRRQRWTVQESKTGKGKRVYVPHKLWRECMQYAGEAYVWPSRNDPHRHRTRQAVYKDLRRVAGMYRLDGRKLQEHVSPHTVRKVYAVEQYRRTGSMAKVRALLNHSNEAVTMLYAMADMLTDKRLRRGR